MRFTAAQIDAVSRYIEIRDSPDAFTAGGRRCIVRCVTLAVEKYASVWDR
jgi:hypothetical protein